MLNPEADHAQAVEDDKIARLRAKAERDALDTAVQIAGYLISVHILDPATVATRSFDILEALIAEGKRR